jgi:hypothetical protein
MSGLNKEVGTAEGVPGLGAGGWNKDEEEAPFPEFATFKGTQSFPGKKRRTRKAGGSPGHDAPPERKKLEEARGKGIWSPGIMKGAARPSRDQALELGAGRGRRVLG